MRDGRFLTLGIETSCDETAASVTADGRRMLSNVISSQIETHVLYGGVVPEIASRMHLEAINTVIDKALADAGCELSDIDLIGVTNGPGLIGAVVIGVATAKALSLAAGIPLVGVNHMHGHVSANYLAYPDLEPPFIAVVVSGGHTDIIRAVDYDEFEVLGSTRDDAAGEAFDKVARVIGLGYPGGPKIDRAAKKGDPDAVRFKRVLLDDGSLDFSFSGLKTQVLSFVNRERMRGCELKTEDIAAAFQSAVVETICAKARLAMEKYGEKRIVMAGGVASNSALRQAMEKMCGDTGTKLYVPDPGLCTDNAAMISCAAYYKYMKHGADGLDLDAYADMPY